MDPLGGGDPDRVGPFQLLGRLGAGGMGQVFLGRNPRGELAAVKIVHPGLAHDEGFRERFRREVRIGGRVTGPWVAALVAADPDAPVPWLATQYVRGPSLGAAVEALGPLGPGTVHVLAHGLATALAAVHGVGLVHRDLKPSNVLLGADHPRLIDFGVSGPIGGAPAFRSPEQVAGARVGPASDVFALGSVLTYAATGRNPFGDHPPAVLVVRISGHEPDLDGVPAAVRGAVAACLAKRPQDRPTAAELGGMLGAVVAEGPGWLPDEVVALGARVVGPVPAPAGPGAGAPPFDRRTWFAVVGVVGLTAGGATLAVAFGPAAGRGLLTPVTVDAPEPRVRWTAPIPWWTGVPPVVVGEREVYVCCRDDAGAGTVLALDSTTGARRWNVPGWPPVPGTGLAFASMALTEGVLVIGTEAVLAGLDAGTGRRLWELPRSAPFSRTVAVTAGMVVAATDGGLTAVDARSGQRIWGGESTSSGGLPASVVVRDGECVSGESVRVYARELRTGALRWTHDTDTGEFPLLVSAGATVVTGFRDAVVALAAATGRPRWSARLPLVVDTPGDVGVVGEVLVVQVPVGQDRVGVRGLDLTGGVARWTLPERGDAVRSGVLVGDGRVYVQIAGGPTCAYDGATGRPRWAHTGAERWRPVAVRGPDAYLFSQPPARLRAVTSV